MTENNAAIARLKIAGPSSESVRQREARRPTTMAINLEESWQCRWWADCFGVDRTALLAAIQEVGVDAESVRQTLLKHNR